VALTDLAQQLRAARFTAWPEPPTVLCRSDPNSSNLVRRPEAWASVDWENSGWGDPAFEVADLMAHPAYAQVTAARWERVISDYCGLRDDPGAAARIRVYYTITLAWWVARLARYLHEVPRGLDPRLAERPASWQAETWAKYERYLEQAHTALDAW
jgi:thiamine kinase-like enzyme